MAKQLWFRNDHVVDGAVAKTHRGDNSTKLNGAAAFWLPLLLAEARGPATAVQSLAALATVAGPTNGLEFLSSATGTPAAEWLSEPLSADFTISGTITLNLWARESNNAANASINAVVEKMDGATGALTQIVKTARTTELGTTAAAANFTAAPTSTACKRGDRLRVRVFADDAAANMAAGQTVIFDLNRSTAAQGDSWIQFTENLTFETTAPTGSTYYLTDTASTVNPGAAVEKAAAQTRGSGSVNANTTTIAGPTAGIQATDTAGGSALEWYTPPLEAVSIGGRAKFNIRAFETPAGTTNASLAAEIAVTAGDGSTATVWGTARNEPRNEVAGGEIGGIDNAGYVVWVAGDDTAITAGQRLRIRVYVDDLANALLAAGTVTISYNGTTASAAGDTYVVLPVTVVEQSVGPTTHFGATSSSYSFNRVTAGSRKTFAATATPLTVAIAVAGIGVTPGVTHYGALAASFAFTATTAARRRTTGATANPYTFAASSAAQRKTFGATAAPLTFTKAVAASRRTFSSTALPITFTKSVSGIGTTPTVTHYGQLVAPYTFAAVTQGQRKTFSTLAAPFAFAAATQAKRRTTSSTAAAFTFGAVTASRKQYARTATPLAFNAAIAARKKTYGVVARPITFGAVTAGIGFTGAATHFGATTVVLIFSATTAGKKKTYGVVARPTTFAAVVQGKRTTKAQVAATFTFSRVVQAQRRTFSTISRPIIFSIYTNGTTTAGGPILNNATDIRWGTIQADRVLVGTEEVWTP